MGHSRPRWKNAQRKSGQEDKGDAIPDELLGLVFLRLTSPLDLVRAAFACRSWRKVIAAEDFRVLSARHGAPSSIVAGHYHISFSHCHYRPSGLLPHFVPSSSSCWAGVAANNLALDFLPRAPNGAKKRETDLCRVLYRITHGKAIFVVFFLIWHTAKTPLPCSCLF
ncbi:hypothetical protein QYE76_010957 [Lolium multiflorum]|uniref:F-box domain-containing protein n=1 Tax=Lolium multiflorum TaxID=4521 RepID=A0AAD8TYA7_LOLMU|nr:hypothetical protein QYE76_010957 [Lolium multiflorum]